MAKSIVTFTPDLAKRLVRVVKQIEHFRMTGEGVAFHVGPESISAHITAGLSGAGGGVAGWLGLLDATDKTPYADHRYWVKRAHSSNITGTSEDAVQLDADISDQELQVTATNLAELPDETHRLPQGLPVYVLQIVDEQTSPILRYWFVAEPEFTLPAGTGRYKVLQLDAGDTPIWDWVRAH